MLTPADYMRLAALTGAPQGAPPDRLLPGAGPSLGLFSPDGFPTDTSKVSGPAAADYEAAAEQLPPLPDMRPRTPIQSFLTPSGLQAAGLALISQGANGLPMDLGRAVATGASVAAQHATEQSLASYHRLLDELQRRYPEGIPEPVLEGLATRAAALGDRVTASALEDEIRTRIQEGQYAFERSKLQNLGTVRVRDPRTGRTLVVRQILRPDGQVENVPAGEAGATPLDPSLAASYGESYRQRLDQRHAEDLRADPRYESFFAQHPNASYDQFRDTFSLIPRYRGYPDRAFRGAYDAHGADVYSQQKLQRETNLANKGSVKPWSTDDVATAAASFVQRYGSEQGALQAVHAMLGQAGLDNTTRSNLQKLADYLGG